MSMVIEETKAAIKTNSFETLNSKQQELK